MGCAVPGPPVLLVESSQWGSGPAVCRESVSRVGVASGKGVRTVNSSHQFAWAIAAVRLWEGSALSATVVDAPRKSIAAVAARALWRFSVPDHPM